MARELRFASTNEALQHLSNITGKRVKVAKSYNEVCSDSEGRALYIFSYEDMDRYVSNMLDVIAKSESAYAYEDAYIRGGDNGVAIVTGVASVEKAQEYFQKCIDTDSEEQGISFGTSKTFKKLK